MPHITEDTVTRLRDRITPGTYLTGSYFQDHRTPFGSDFHRTETVAFDNDGRLTITYHWYTGGAKRVQNVYFSPETMIAIQDMTELRPGVWMQTHNNSRLILPGGFMDACSGGNLRTWDVYRTDGTPIAQEIGTADARALLDECTPEMIWVDKGDGKFIARGHGREWMVTRDGRAPEYDAHTSPLSRFWLYALMSRPLGAHEYVAVARGCATAEEARGAAPAPTRQT